ncbi:START domain-containing protein [Pseudomonas sp. BGr12]|uniref:START domain-containing protein n=1 Tax=unclassified Pseudomonas TaxID=196821 RepID=UPI00177D87FA|nr:MULTISPECIES: START domain-containing protein [unclassified Pseudomonas]MBD9504554.1 START domain-containing protein [Pseudomonas sp. PDM17]MBD9574774.1 START domain-containing protein [Pseudomonas sp. PDM23]MBD9673805.1 START domain-containing protein [Pseudomonas sp. PDM21]MDL2426230.1 START domain-containing protein [Pseudomonas sp. BJa5]
MKRSPPLLLALLLTAPALAQAQAADWKLAKDQDGVQVYLSDVPGSRYKSFRGVTLVRADVATLGHLQENLRVSCAWLYSCAQMRLLKYSDEAIWVYLDTKLPWPAAPRDLVLRVSTEETPDGGMIRHLQAAPDYIPPVKDRIRVPSVSGTWQMVPKGPKLTEVTYEMRGEPGGSVPSWLANQFVVDAPFESLRMLKVVAEHQGVRDGGY